MDLWLKIRQHKKWSALGLVLLLVAAGGAIYYKKQAAPVTLASTAIVERRDIRSIVSATGTILPVNSVEISSRVTGLINEVTVEENDLVKAGQVLVVLDDSSLQAQVDQYRTQLLNYAAIYERSKKIAAIGAVSTQQLESDRTNYLVAQATYDNYAAQLKYYVIKAPIDGMVIGKPTPAGQTVAQGISSPQVMMTIADMSQMQIKVQVDETDIGKVKLGQNVEFAVDAYPAKTFTGKISLISRSAVTQNNVVYYPVYVNVEAGEGLLYPTMTARVSIGVGESKNTLVVPLAALKEVKGEKYVQVIRGGQAQQVPIQIGLSDDTTVEISQGLSEGEQVMLPVVKQRSTVTKNMPGPPPL